MDSLAFKKHNHKHCIENSISKVELMCENARLILTPVRKRVLEILLKEHQALGAYKILDILLTVLGISYSKNVCKIKKRSFLI